MFVADFRSCTYRIDAPVYAHVSDLSLVRDTTDTTNCEFHATNLLVDNPITGTSNN